MHTLVQISGGGVQQPMIPTQPLAAAASAKRKVPDDENPLSKPAKRLKNEALSKSNAKRKLNGEEQLGGLVIVRGPSRPSSAQDHHRPQTFHPSSTQINPSSTAGPSKPTPKESSNKPPSSRGKHKGQERDPPLPSIIDEEVEEDVRRMDSEADNLRDRSRSHAASLTPGKLRSEFKFPGPPGSAAKSRVRQLQARESQGGSNRGHAGIGTPQANTSRKDMMQPITEQETPQIAKNKAMRGEHPSMKRASSASSLSVDPARNIFGPAAAVPGNLGHSRRRSSMSMRGKRVSASFENTGIISQPHTSVSDSSLYKHIDADLPESQRARQLLLWASSRALPDTPGVSASPPRRKSTPHAPPPNTNLPPLPPGGLEFLRTIEEDLIQQLAEKLIDTSVHSAPGDEDVTKSNKKVKENEQNVRNRAREVLFMDQIKAREAESAAWTEVSKFYNAHQLNTISSMDKRLSDKAKGKQRAVSQEADLDPREDELDGRFRGPNGFAVARSLLEQSASSIGTGDGRLKDLQYKEDRIHAAVSSAHQFARIASADLDHRFVVLGLTLSQRSNFAPSPHPTHPGALSNYLPPTSEPLQRQPAPDPQDLLRALSRVDAARPPDRVGDAVRRAAKDVQRVHEGADSGMERKLTGVPPPTPRKPPGTPRRSNTPAAGRRG